MGLFIENSGRFEYEENNKAVIFECKRIKLRENKPS